MRWTKDPWLLNEFDKLLLVKLTEISNNQIINKWFWLPVETISTNKSSDDVEYCHSNASFNKFATSICVTMLPQQQTVKDQQTGHIPVSNSFKYLIEIEAVYIVAQTFPHSSSSRHCVILEFNGFSLMERERKREDGYEFIRMHSIKYNVFVRCLASRLYADYKRSNSVKVMRWKAAQYQFILIITIITPISTNFQQLLLAVAWEARSCDSKDFINKYLLWFYSNNKFNDKNVRLHLPFSYSSDGETDQIVREFVFVNFAVKTYEMVCIPTMNYLFYI